MREPDQNQIPQFHLWARNDVGRLSVERKCDRERQSGIVGRRVGVEIARTELLGVGGREVLGGPFCREGRDRDRR